MIVFLDIEASSLEPDGFPIEIGWVGETGGADGALIAPAAAWMGRNGSCPGWSEASELVHGIGLRTLLEQGEPAREVALRVAGVLRAPGVILCSDWPAFDAAWLRRLLRATGLDAPVRLTDVRHVYAQACRPLHARMMAGASGLDDENGGLLARRCMEIVSAAEAAEASRDRPRHRARHDAEGLRRTWRAVTDEVARVIGSST